MKWEQKIGSLPPNPARALLVICSESALHTVLANILDPACILQNLGGTLPEGSSDSGWGTVEYAIEQLGLRQIVLCGHSHCQAALDEPVISQIESPAVHAAGVADSAGKRSSADSTVRSQLWLVEQLSRLSLFLDRRAHRAEITAHALWFNDDRGTLFTWSSIAGRFMSTDDSEIRQLLNLFDLSSEKAQEVIDHLEEFSQPLTSKCN